MKCLICKNNKDFRLLKSLFCDSNNYLCLKCGLVFIPRRSKSTQQYYKRDGYFKKSPNISYRKILFSKSLFVEISRRRVESARDILPVDFENMRVLDIGCGYGEIIYYLKQKYNSKVVGIEASPETAEYGNKIFNVPIEPLLLEEFKSREKFDVILCSHILEHVSDPNLFLQKIKTLLTKNGLLYIEVPNILKPTGKFDLNTFLYSEHLQTFSAYNLYILLLSNKLNVVAYSDRNFLKFWCQTDKKGTKMKTISSFSILEFLKVYKDKYNFLNYVAVYKQKISYGLKLLFYKIYDIFYITR